MRKSDIARKTAETDITLSINLDGGGAADIDTGIGVLDHMLTLFARHGRFDLRVVCTGDTYVDDHHSVEDVGLCLGAAFHDALGDKRGITRYGDITLPMDETLILCAVDISGRSHLSLDVPIDTPTVGTLDTELIEEFLLSFTRKAGITLHLKKLAGTNTHHIIEGCFKALARALAKAVRIDAAYSEEIPSTKGVL
jgi:imidazoleglycerol-phosphate dehydratase